MSIRVMRSALLLFVLPAIAQAGTVTLVWDAVPDSRVVGYEVGYGTKAGDRATLVATPKTTLDIPNLPTGSAYYFAVRAYGADRCCDSAWSNEASTQIRFDAPKNFKVTIQITVGVN